MNKIIAALLVMLVPFGLARAVPNGISYSGTVDEGEFITVSGNDFGSGSIVLTWDDFDSGAPGTTIDGEPAVYGFPWDVAANIPGGNHDIQYSTGRAYSGNQSARVWWYQASLLYMGWVGKGPYPEIYWSYRRYHDPRGPGDSEYTVLPTNHKQSYLFGTQSDGYPHFMVGAIMIASNNPWPTAWQGPNGSDDNELDNQFNTPLTYVASSFRWQRWELYIKYNTLGNTDGEQFGRVIDDQTGNQHSIYLDNVSFTTSPIDGARDWRIGYMYQGWGGAEIAQSYFDDIWVATNRSRVEIGNNSVFLSCTKRDIQPHTSWSDGSISVDVSVPSFASYEEAYLFVINSAGEVNSPGIFIRIGDVGAEVISAPTNVAASDGVEESVITWDLVADASLDYYHVLRADAVGGPYQIVSGAAGSVDEGTETYTDTGLNAGQTYWYVVVAVPDPPDPWSSYSTPPVSAIPTGSVSTNVSTPDSLRLSPLLELDMPIYGHWGFNYPATLGSGDYDDLAEYDVGIFHVQPFIDTDYAGFVDSVRARNPDYIPLTYCWVFGARTSWSSSSGIYKELWDLGENNSDGYQGADGVLDFWMYNDDGDYVLLDFSGNISRAFNPAAPGLADSLANIYIEYMEDQGNLKGHVGVFLDWLYTPDYPRWPISPWGSGRDKIDMDEDGIPWGDGTGGYMNYTDTDEPVLYYEFVTDIADAFRRRANRNDFLVISNGNSGYYPTSAPYFDGAMYEQWSDSDIFPSTRTTLIDALVDYPALMDDSRVKPPLVFWQHIADSLGVTDEAIASIGEGVATFTSSTATFTALSDFGPVQGAMSFGERVSGSVAVSATGDTSFAKFWDGADTTYVWAVGHTGSLPLPYLITKGSTGMALADTVAYGSNGIRAD